MDKVKEIVAYYEMKPHPEGGYYKETYRSAGKFHNHHHSTAIYYLLEAGQKSSLHRIKSDEVWHFYGGDSLVVAEILPSGEVKETTLGTDFKKGELVQYVVPAGNWFGAYLPDSSKYAFVGCTVSPGFEFADFELADRTKLLKEFPRASNLIDRLNPR